MALQDKQLDSGPSELGGRCQMAPLYYGYDQSPLTRYLLLKVGPANAERFCAAFKTVHEKLVYKELSLEAAQRFISTDKTDMIRTDS
ncbi:hypothetical protein IEQ34_011644 [Dendrobium chrysotoxum]|uniref:Uncharacterized protein n=1 Tax=Dendrobium chrysotoxum TaxID=161865 RepID=A0AAV7GRB4_DENCH|nr:hypothetical protein IEQ34_011644 [Dendrobium chrysotoxum]